MNQPSSDFINFDCGFYIKVPLESTIEQYH